MIKTSATNGTQQAQSFRKTVSVSQQDLQIKTNHSPISTFVFPQVMNIAILSALRDKMYAN